MNRLVPYLDLFCRLSDEELCRLTRVPQNAVESLRQQVEEVNRALGRFVDLLPRLSDDELARLTGATVKTIRFWRLSQPRHLQGRSSNPDLTPAPAPLPRRDGGVHRSSEDSSSSSSPSLSSSSSSSGSRRRDSELSDGEVTEPSAAESATFVIDTVE